jgi:hypothetical protein
MDIDSLSRPYDPELDDVEMGAGESEPVQHFLFGGLAERNVTATPPAPTATYLDPTNEEARVAALKATFANAKGAFQGQATNAPAAQTYNSNPFVMTMPIDPVTGAPKNIGSYKEAGAQKMLEDYNAAVKAVPYRAPSKAQMPTMADLNERNRKRIPGLGRYNDPILYDSANNPNYEQFKYDPNGRSYLSGKFAYGGLVEDDDEDKEASGARQMMRGYEQLTGPRETRVVSSPNRQSVRTRQASQIVDKQGRPAGMSMSTSSMTTAQGPSQATPEQLATAKAMLSDLMRQNLSKRRFADGGEASNFTSGASDKKGAPEDKLTFGDKYLVEPALDLYSKIMGRESLPANKRIFLDSVRGGDRSQITEKNFSPDELAQMDELIRGRYKKLSEPLTKYGQHLEEVLKGKLSKEEKSQYMTDLEMIKKFQAGQFTPGLMALAEGEEPSNARRRGLVMSGAAGDLAKLGKILPQMTYADYPKGVVQKSRSLSAGKIPAESNATSLGQFKYGLGPDGNFVIKDDYDFNERKGSEDLDAVPSVVTEGLYGRLREYAGRKMPPGQGREVLVNLQKRADGSPEEGEGYVKPSNPFAGKAAKQAEMRAARDERSRVAAAREKVARTPALDEAGGETTDEFIQRTMGFDPSVNEQRGTFLPQRIKRNGKTEWIAPNIVKDAALPFALSRQALTTNRFDPEKVPEAAMNISLASLATGKAPAGSLGMAVKIPGGQWRHSISVTDPVTGETIRGRPSNMSEYIARAMERVPEGREDVKEFIVNKLYPYLKKSLGTDSDPIRSAVLEGKVKDDSPLYYGMPPAFREYMLEPAREAQGLQAKIAATEPRIAELRQASQEARDRGLTAEADSAAAQLKALQRTLPYTDAEKRAFATKSEALQDFHRNYDTKTGIATKIISDPGEGERADHGLSGAAIETIRNRLTEAGVRPEHQNVPTYVENLTLNDFAKKLFPDNEDHQQALIQGVRSGDPRYKQISDAIAFNEPLYDLANSSGVDIPGFKQQEIGQLLSEIPADKLKKMSAAEAFVTAFPTYQLTKDFSGLVEKIRAGAAYPKEALDLYLNRGLQPVKVPDTPGWYRVTTPQAVRLEGAQMRHSVGGYATQDNYNKGGRPAFNAGTTRVYSLRPQKNKPEVTLDVYDDPDTGLVKVNTIYGKENSDPSPYKEELFKLFDSIPNLDSMSLPRLYYGRRENSPSGTVDWAREYLEARPNVQVPSPRPAQRSTPGPNAWENVGQDDNLMRQVIDMVNNAPGNEAQMAARQRIRDRIAARNARRAAEGIPPVEEE